MKIRVSIRRKILLTFGLFFLMSLVVTLYGYYKYFLLNQKIHLVESKDTVFNSILEARRYEKNFFITLDPQHLEDALDYAGKSRRDLAQLIERYGDYAQTKNLPQQLNDLSLYESELRDFLLICKGDGAVERIHPGNISSFHTREAELRSMGRKVTEALEGGLQQERRHVRKLIRESRWYLFLFMGLIVILACGTFLFLLVNVDRPLKNISDGIRKIADGDYKHIPVIQTGDEFEKLAVSLNTLLEELDRRSDQLVQSEKMAALGTLTSGVAHELNNPLNNISTSLQIIMEELGEGDLAYQRDLLVESEGEVNRAQDIVKALLEFSRETEFTLSQEQFKTLVNNTLKLIQGEVPPQVNIDVDVPESIYAFLDPRRIQQVLLNLIMNAIHAMEESGGELTIRARAGDNSKEFLFEVSDTGKGIPEAEFSKIFDPFYTTKDVGMGSGLGLSVSKGIIESHGGRIEVRSQLGAGSTFSVFMPYSPGKVAKQSPSATRR